MTPHHISSEELWFLSALWETRSLSLAAKKLDVSIATATRLIARTRELLQDPLFVRGSRGFVPTPRMTALYPKIQAAQSSLIDIARSGAFNPEAIRTTVRCAGIDNAMLIFLLPAAHEIYRKAPGIRLAFQPITEDYAKELERGTLDLAFYAPPTTQRAVGLRVAGLFQTSHTLVVRKGHPILDEIRAREASRLPVDETLLLPYKEIELTYGPFSARKMGDTSISPEETSAVAFESAYFLPSVFLILESDFYMRLPLKSAFYLQKYLPIVRLPQSIRELPTWEGKMLWHERTDFDETLRWVRSVIVRKTREDAS